MAVINQIFANQILDSRGIPTIRVNLTLDTGHVFESSVPAGTSTGKYEAVEIRDGNKLRYFGMEVTNAIANINDIIAPKLQGQDPSKQSEIDQMLIQLDGTKNKSKLGANATLAVSQVVCKAGAAIYNLHLFDYIHKKYGVAQEDIRIPVPTFNMINGGKHGAGNLDFQEFVIIPTATKTYPEALRLSVEIYHSLETALTQMNAIHSVGIEGGFAPNLFTNKDALEIIIESIRRTDYIFSKDVFLGLDVAGSYFYAEGRYKLKDRPKPVNADELIEYYKELNSNINLYFLEDPFIEDDWKSWNTLTEEIGANTLIIGDDLIATNKERLARAVKEKSCSAVLIKPNQIGTVSETAEVIRMAREAQFQVVVSHRSGETNDTFIADFAVGIGANFTKFGAPSRGERTVKYNRLLDIYRINNPNPPAPENSNQSQPQPQSQAQSNSTSSTPSPTQSPPQTPAASSPDTTSSPAQPSSTSPAPQTQPSPAATPPAPPTQPQAPTQTPLPPPQTYD